VKKSARAVIGTAAGMIALATNAGPALASAFTLELAMPPAVVAPPIVLNATGTIPVDQIQYPCCHALLGGAGGRRCVRRAVKHAKAHCRQYRSHRRQARCLRQVRQVASRGRAGR